MTNTSFTAVAGLVLALHLLALAATIRRWRDGRPIRAANLCVAVAILTFLAQRPQLFLPPVDGRMLALGGFALCSGVAAVAAMLRLPWAMRLCWLVFAAQMLASLAAVTFALTFRMTRLF